MDYGTQALDASDRILEAIGGALGESVPNAANLVLSIVTRDTLNLCFNWEGEFYRALTHNGAIDFSVVSA